MEKRLFREKSLEHISSPDKLKDYMRVANPRVWMLLAAIALILVGFIVYASTVKMENLMPLQVTIQTITPGDEEQQTFVDAELPISARQKVAQGMKLRVGNEEGVLVLIYEYEDILHLSFEMEKKQMDLPDGTYDAELVLEERTPISFLVG